MHIYNKVIGRGLRCAMAALVAAMVSGIKVQALTFDFDQTLNGVAPAGPAPWLTAVFTDAGANTVQLTLAAPGLSGNEFVNQLYFNLNPNLNSGSLVFTQIGASGNFNSPNVQSGGNAFKPAGDGKYDILFNFNPSNGQFGSKDSITFDITGVDGLSSSDFLFYNTTSAGHAPLYAAAYIQTVGESVIVDHPPELNSGAVPDVAPTLILMGMTFLALAVAKMKTADCLC